MKMEKEIKSVVFTNELLTALSNWQNGWAEIQERRYDLADELVKQCKDVPEKFKKINSPCYRKRFIYANELKRLFLEDDLFEGISSWTTDMNYAKGFKGYVRQGASFSMMFECIPRPEDIVLNISELWKDEDFVHFANQFKINFPKKAKPLFNFKDTQSEVVLRSTLRSFEIRNVVGFSSSFEEICDMGNIPEDEREELSIKYEQDPNGIPINMPVFVDEISSRESVARAIACMKKELSSAEKENEPINWGDSDVKSMRDEIHRSQN